MEENMRLWEKITYLMQITSLYTRDYIIRKRLTFRNWECMASTTSSRDLEDNIEVWTCKHTKD